MWLILQGGAMTEFRAAAFFDLDRTLIRGSAVFPLAVAAFRAGHVPPRDLLHDAVNAVAFVLRGATDERSVALRERVLRAVAGQRVDDVVAPGDRFLHKLVASVLPESRRLLHHHAERGDDRVIVSASPVEIVAELADRLGLEAAVGTRSEIEGGRYTGRLDGAFCYGEGKVAEVQRIAADRGYDLARSTAYSDSVSDLPFLESVGTAVAVNPDRELRAIAASRGWRVVEVARKPLPAEPAVRAAASTVRSLHPARRRLS
jgi:HAD superfamily hydrolase (TIGR01490 family)